MFREDKKGTPWLAVLTKSHKEDLGVIVQDGLSHDTHMNKADSFTYNLLKNIKQSFCVHGRRYAEETNISYNLPKAWIYCCGAVPI